MMLGLLVVHIGLQALGVNVVCTHKNVVMVVRKKSTDAIVLGSCLAQFGL